MGGYIKLGENPPKPCMKNHPSYEDFTKSMGENPPKPILENPIFKPFFIFEVIRAWVKIHPLKSLYKPYVYFYNNNQERT